jgi:hypothetical protein
MATAIAITIAITLVVAIKSHPAQEPSQDPRYMSQVRAERNKGNDKRCLAGQHQWQRWAKLRHMRRYRPTAFYLAGAAHVCGTSKGAGRDDIPICAFSLFAFFS